MAPRGARSLVSRRLGQLERRRAWLAKRLDGYQGRDPNHDKAELAALEWALPILVRAVDEEPVMEEVALRLRLLRQQVNEGNWDRMDLELSGLERLVGEYVAGKEKL